MDNFMQIPFKDWKFNNQEKNLVKIKTIKT